MSVSAGEGLVQELVTVTVDERPIQVPKNLGLVAAALVGATGSFWLVGVFLAVLSVLTTACALLARETAFDRVDTVDAPVPQARG